MTQIRQLQEELLEYVLGYDIENWFRLLQKVSEILGEET